METLQTMFLTSAAEIFIALRYRGIFRLSIQRPHSDSSVYAITKKNIAFPCIAGLILAAQWAMGIYVMSLSSSGSGEPALLLSRDLPPLPTLPDIDPFHGKHNIKITQALVDIGV